MTILLVWVQAMEEHQGMAVRQVLLFLAQPQPTSPLQHRHIKRKEAATKMLKTNYERHSCHFARTQSSLSSTHARPCLLCIQSRNTSTLRSCPLAGESAWHPSHSSMDTHGQPIASWAVRDAPRNAQPFEALAASALVLMQIRPVSAERALPEPCRARLHPRA